MWVTRIVTGRVVETGIGAGPPLHVHDREDECLYVLDGELTVRCGGDAFTAAAGSFVFLPRSRPHRFWAPGPPARLLLIAVPGGIEDYFLQINAAASDQERRQVGERYGIPSCPDRQPKPATAIAGPPRTQSGHGDPVLPSTATACRAHHAAERGSRLRQAGINVAEAPRTP
jgi:hypothetical protein